MSCAQMVCHAADQLRMALGDIDTRRGRGPMAHFPMKHLIIHAVPWPKGRAQAGREAFTTDPGDFEEDRQTLVELIDRVAERDGQSEWPHNPVFGGMNQHLWGVLSAKHLDHHLRQFGI